MKIPIEGPLSALPELPGPRVPIGAGEAPGLELARMGAEGQHLAAQWQLVENRLELARQSVAAAKFLGDISSDMTGSIEHPDTSLSTQENFDNFKKVYTQRVNEYTQGIQNQVIRSRIQTGLLHHVDTQAIEMRRSAFEAIHRDVLAEHLKEGEKAAQQYAITGNPELLQAHVSMGESMVTSGMWHADVAETYNEKFLAHAEIGRVEHEATLNPWLALSKIATGQYNLSGLTEQEQWELESKIQGRISHINTLNKEARTEAEDAFKGKMTLDIDAGVYGKGDKIDETRIRAMLPGHKSETIDHVLAKVAAEKKTENKLEIAASDRLARGYRIKIRDATTPEQAKSLMRSAELENIQPKDLEGIQVVYEHQLNHLDAMMKHTVDEKTNQIKEQESQKDQARKEANMWLPSLHAYEIKMDPDMFDSRARIQDYIDASIDQEASAGRNPVEWVRKNRTDIEVRFYKSAEAAYNAKKSELLSYGYKSPDELRTAIAAGRVPPQQEKYLKELAINAKDLNEWLAKNKSGGQ